jgi:hypothetical protein
MQPKLIENFISSENAEKLNAFLRSKSKIGPKGLFTLQLSPLDLNKYPEGKEMHNFVEFIINNIITKYDLDGNLKIDRAMYQVLQKGDELGWHTDQYGGVDGYSDAFYSALLYLTDDYEGGEIVFYDDLSGNKEKSTSYKPAAGTLLYFKGDQNSPHSVNTVISGERSNIILFYKLVNN